MVQSSIDPTNTTVVTSGGAEAEYSRQDGINSGSFGEEEDDPDSPVASDGKEYSHFDAGLDPNAATSDDDSTLCESDGHSDDKDAKKSLDHDERDPFGSDTFTTPTVASSGHRKCHRYHRHARRSATPAPA